MKFYKEKEEVFDMVVECAGDMYNDDWSIRDSSISNDFSSDEEFQIYFPYKDYTIFIHLHSIEKEDNIFNLTSCELKDVVKNNIFCFDDTLLFKFNGYDKKNFKRVITTVLKGIKEKIEDLQQLNEI